MESCAVNFVVQYDRTGFEYIRVNISNKRRVTTILIITTSQSISKCKCLILYVYTSFLCEIIVFVSWHLKSAIILLMRYIFFCFLQFIVNRKGLFYFITFRQCCTEIAKESSWNKKIKKNTFNRTRKRIEVLLLCKYETKNYHESHMEIVQVGLNSVTCVMSTMKFVLFWIRNRV